MSECPYYLGDYQQCNLYSTSQGDSQRQEYCRTSDAWRRCANYEKASYDSRSSKALRPNPYL
jgi:hypothetical protein